MFFGYRLNFTVTKGICFRLGIPFWLGAFLSWVIYIGKVKVVVERTGGVNWDGSSRRTNKKKGKSIL